jgi:LysM repeat protein
MKNRLFIFFIFLLSGLVSCKSSKPLATSRSTTSPQKSSASVTLTRSISEYISMYSGLAVSEMKRTGIPASITLAQGIIESDCGRSDLAIKGNNHFGIKCHDWTGPTMKHDDNAKNECFRSYDKAEESFHDHSDFLKSGSRYSFLFNNSSTDYKSWAYGLKKAGYATNPDYANMVIRTIEVNNLWKFDQVTNFSGPPVTDTIIKIAAQSKVSINSSDSTKRNTQAKIVSVDSTKRIIQPTENAGVVTAKVQRVKENNKLKYIIVRDGDTREKLENEFQLLRGELPRYNDMKNDFKLVPGEILYLQPKKDKAEEGKEFYNFTDGDTMYDISQQFGIKLKKLYEMNRMTEGTEPEAGQKIWLRSIKPVV